MGLPPLSSAWGHGSAGVKVLDLLTWFIEHHFHVVVMSLQKHSQKTKRGSGIEAVLILSNSAEKMMIRLLNWYSGFARADLDASQGACRVLNRTPQLCVGSVDDLKEDSTDHHPRRITAGLNARLNSSSRNGLYITLDRCLCRNSGLPGIQRSYDTTPGTLTYPKK